MAESAPRLLLLLPVDTTPGTEAVRYAALGLTRSYGGVVADYRIKFAAAQAAGIPENSVYSLESFDGQVEFVCEPLPDPDSGEVDDKGPAAALTEAERAYLAAGLALVEDGVQTALDDPDGRLDAACSAGAARSLGCYVAIVKADKIQWEALSKHDSSPVITRDVTYERLDGLLAGTVEPLPQPAPATEEETCPIPPTSGSPRG